MNKLDEIMKFEELILNDELGYEHIDRYYYEYYQKHIVDGIYLTVQKWENLGRVYISLPTPYLRITTQKQIDNLEKAYEQLQIDQAIINKWKEMLENE